MYENRQNILDAIKYIESKICLSAKSTSDVNTIKTKLKEKRKLNNKEQKAFIDLINTHFLTLYPEYTAHKEVVLDSFNKIIKEYNTEEAKQNTTTTEKNISPSKIESSRNQSIKKEAKQNTTTTENNIYPTETESSINQSIKKEAKHYRKDGSLFLKSLSGLAGCGVGVGLGALTASSPLIGVTLTAYTSTRAIYQTVKFANNIITKYNTKKGKTEPTVITKITNKFKEKHPIISNCIEKLYDSPKNPYIKWFINGVSIGYLADRVFNIHEQIGNNFNKQNIDKLHINKNKDISNPKINPNDKLQGGKTALLNDKNNNLLSKKINTEIKSTKINNHYDISNIENGYTSSYGEGYTHLNTKLGKDAILEKKEWRNGKLWDHFISASDNDKYAWILDETVKKKAKIL